MIRLRLDEILQEKNMSAYALHINSGKKLHQSVISKIKNNDSKALQLDTLNMLCELLECSPGDLIVYENANATRNEMLHDAPKPTQIVKPTQSVNTQIVDATQSASDNESDKYTLTSADAGRLLDLSPRTVREHAEKGTLKGKQGKQNHWFFRRSDIVDFIAQREAE